jgi:hypothetical protein
LCHDRESRFLSAAGAGKAQMPGSATPVVCPVPWHG